MPIPQSPPIVTTTCHPVKTHIMANTEASTGNRERQAYINNSPIVRQMPGRGTGDTIYVTADGRRWRNLGPGESVAPGTGETRGSMTYR